MNSSQCFAVRLASLRKNSGLSQKEFAVRFSEYLGKSMPYAPSTISSWEVGAKNPTTETLIAMADFFGVSLNYLRGVSNDRTPSDEERVSITKYKYLVPADKLKSYDHTPVWLQFDSPMHEDKWGIISMETNSIVCEAEVLSLSQLEELKCQFYILPMPNDIFRDVFLAEPMSFSKMRDSKESFWVEVVAPSSIKTRYDGWYHHNEDKSCIINDRGLTLPYSGFGISWRAYVSPFMD